MRSMKSGLWQLLSLIAGIGLLAAYLVAHPHEFLKRVDPVKTSQQKILQDFSWAREFSRSTKPRVVSTSGMTRVYLEVDGINPSGGPMRKIVNVDLLEDGSVSRVRIVDSMFSP